MSSDLVATPRLHQSAECLEICGDERLREDDAGGRAGRDDRDQATAEDTMTIDRESFKRTPRRRGELH